MTKKDYDALAEAMGDLNENKVMEMTDDFMGEKSGQVMEFLNALSRGMQLVSQHFDDSDYFVGDLIYAGEIFSRSLETVRPRIQEDERVTLRAHRVILCTVEGDYHDIGKNIVRYVMESRGLDVVDLGVNVPPEQIVNTAKTEKISVIALSGVLSFATESMEKTIQAFEKEKMRDKVKILIGGSCTTEYLAEKIGADAYGNTPRDSADICIGWLKE